MSRPMSFSSLSAHKRQGVRDASIPSRGEAKVTEKSGARGKTSKRARPSVAQPSTYFRVVCRACVTRGSKPTQGLSTKCRLRPGISASQLSPATLTHESSQLLRGRPVRRRLQAPSRPLAIERMTETSAADLQGKAHVATYQVRRAHTIFWQESPGFSAPACCTVDANERYVFSEVGASYRRWSAPPARHRPNDLELPEAWAEASGERTPPTRMFASVRRRATWPGTPTTRSPAWRSARPQGICGSRGPAHPAGERLRSRDERRNAALRRVTQHSVEDNVQRCPRLCHATAMPTAVDGRYRTHRVRSAPPSQTDVSMPCPEWRAHFLPARLLAPQTVAFFLTMMKARAARARSKRARHDGHWGTIHGPRCGVHVWMCSCP